MYSDGIIWVWPSSPAQEPIISSARRSPRSMRRSESSTCAAEHVRAAAVIGERRQRFDRVVLALAGAEIAFQSPERGDHGGRHAEVLLLPRKQGLVLLDLGGAARQPPARQHLVGNLEEVLRKEFLSAVDADDALIEHQVGRGRRDGGLRDARGRRLALEGGEPRLERCRVAAIRSGRMPPSARRCQQRRQRSPNPCIACIVMVRFWPPTPGRPIGRPILPRFGYGTSCSWSGNLLVEWQLAYPDRGSAKARVATLQQDGKSRAFVKDDEFSTTS